MSSHDAIALLRTQSLTNLVHEELEQRIATGQLLPGAPLREAAIATDMGISRGPVREAFRMLEERGLVMFEKNCGVRVRQLDLQQATQIYQVRIPLEGLIGELVTRTLTSEAGEQVRQVLDQMAEKVAHQDVPAYTELNFRFHDLLARFTGNAALYDTYRRLVVQLKLFRSYTFRHDPETIGISLQEHNAIFEAITSPDTSLAGELLRRHAEDSLTRLCAASGSA
ncbi:transcriptional regulator, GntR family [Azotobacter vinelandii CA]|uniref:Transcriptional regulator, GntR family n=2 Tax=Azotobacter vinelandii TaxID=354 RepID=C1DSL2_AZOVD|nr:FCD domain-containing protein [Azotobacter vinelandii]ACO77967.1 transcriptional regulator, GntR family [Azotobacter vinelandii DJ]AGK15193.1 transcriptional regulator, GntR family [Azotobacter vinelandii CA]AGK20131.1 transcriptional regulator, GntR family [Azotobacter vinelandii CA6]WKN23695.1 FCD domain-containing protein [Azotobacter vinelandii]SFY21395.1 DNA-binding transcriptional regulator, GntR family [Azotobacter vinelandii]